MNSQLTDKIRLTIRDVLNFPKQGIVFKDITPILADAELCGEMADEMAERAKKLGINMVAGVEARGFLFGFHLAQKLQVPFVPIRKAGKLPYHTVSYAYDLEYGTATIEMHEDAVKHGDKVLIHDDLLATGGTAGAAAELIRRQGGEVAGFSFIVELEFLKGREKLNHYSNEIDFLVKY